MKKLIFGMLIAVSGLVFYACNKENTEFIGADSLKTNANELVASDSQIDNVIETASYESDIFSLSNSSYSVGLKSGEIGAVNFRFLFDPYPNFKLRYLRGVCPDLTIATTNGGFPKTMTVDYGAGIELANGHILKGKIIVVLSAAPFVSGSTRTITFESFCVDSVCVSGTGVKMRTNDTKRIFSEKSNLVVTMANGTIVTRVEEHQRTWLAGSDTDFNPADDVIEVTGKVVVSDSKGNEYSKNITTALLKTGQCKFITKGVIEYKNSAGRFATIDFGNGDCDNKATRTTLKGTSEITLGR